MLSDNNLSLLSDGDGWGVEVAARGISAVRDAQDLVCSRWFTIPQVHNEGTLHVHQCIILSLI